VAIKTVVGTSYQEVEKHLNEVLNKHLRDNHPSLRGIASQARKVLGGKIVYLGSYPVFKYSDIEASASNFIASYTLLY